MGLRFSKPSSGVTAQPEINSIDSPPVGEEQTSVTSSIKLLATNTNLQGVSSSGSQRVIIKIQLTKMEQPHQEGLSSIHSDDDNISNNILKTESPPPHIIIHAQSSDELQLSSLNLGDDKSGTAGSSLMPTNSSIASFINENDLTASKGASGENEESSSITRNSDGHVPGISIQFDTRNPEGANNSTAMRENEKSHCCRRKTKSIANTTKWRCCKCVCRDAVKKIMDSSATSSKTCNSNGSWASKFNCTKKESKLHTPHAHLENPEPQASTSADVSETAFGSCQNQNVAIWRPGHEVIAISSGYTQGRVVDAPKILVLQCPQVPQFVAVDADLEATLANRTWHSMICTPFIADSSPSANVIATGNAPILGSSGPVVHSQVDYIHCLVPDLEKITSSSFYWGKMDRYEAERLLEGKPEGTFLLRDSAQEEYLFSVTFRKYGRSLHARIEQFNHKFSFDCHDPGVFTASTVTGLLEHYKDPSCVMFFEPMLTIPLNRSFSFSLQQLCRAKIVSSTTYDGINELELPNSLKSYLKEYHYKMRVRVKPFDEPIYSSSVTVSS